MNIKEEILGRTNRGLDVFTYYMPMDFVPNPSLTPRVYFGVVFGSFEE